MGDLNYFMGIGFLFISVVAVVYQLLSMRESQRLHIAEELLSQQGKKKPFNFRSILRILVPVTRHITSRFQMEGTRHKLVMAGNPLTLAEFLAFKLLCVLLLPIVYIIVGGKTEPVWFLVIAAFGFIFPELWLSGRIKGRQQSIARDLPSIIDLLNLCVSGGLDFMLAVNRVVRDYRPCPLTEELSEMWRENQMGSPRREALKSLSWRVHLPEMSSFVRTLIQADRMGSPVGDALRIQAEEMRLRRFQRGEEMAMKAPLKLLFPLLFFILPCVLIIVGGPIMLQFLKGGGLRLS